MRRAEMIGCLVVFLLGAHILQQSLSLPYTEKYGPGGGFLPFWLGWAAMGLSVLHFINLIIQPQLYSGSQPFPKGKVAVHVAALFGVLVVTVFLLGWLGFLVGLAIMVGALARGVERLSWRASILAAVAISVPTYLLFGKILGVPFPRNLLGI